MPHKPGVGAIFGIVSENSIAKDASPVYLMDMRRDVAVGDAKIIGRQLTQPDGGFVFTGLDVDYADYALFASDEDGSPPYNALIEDRVQPISAHSKQDMSAWFERMTHFGAAGAIMGWPVSDDPLHAMGLNSRVVNHQSLSSVDKVISIPNAPQMSGMEVVPGSYLQTACRRFVHGATGAASKAIEVVIDMDSLTFPSGNDVLIIVAGRGRSNADFSPVARFDGGGNRTGYYSYELVFKIDTAKIMTLGRGGEGSYSTIDSISVDLSSYSGLTHIVASWKPSISFDIYINNASVHSSTSSTALANLGLDAVNFFGMFAYDFKGIFALAAYYPVALSGQEVSDLYGCLFGTYPQANTSGTERKILEFFPILFWPFDEADASNGVRSGVGYNDVSNDLATYSKLLPTDETKITYTQFSPIAGRNAMSWDGSLNYYSGSFAGFYGFPFQNQVSFFVWVYFDNATPASIEHIVSWYQPSTTSGIFFRASRNTSNNIQCGVYDSAGQQTYMFSTYNPPNSSWICLAIVVDKVITGSEEIRLYAGNETTTPSLVETIDSTTGSMTGAELTSTDSYTTFFDDSLHARVGHGAFQGRITMPAVIPTKLSLSEIEEIWAAKDIP